MLKKKEIKEQIIEVEIYTIVRDCGDGGYSINCYNNIDELIKDHYHYQDNPTEKMKELILSCDNEYEYGYLNKTIMKLKINKDGGIELAKPLNFHAGQ